MKRAVRWGIRAGRQALVRVVGRGSREQVVVLEAVMISVMRAESAGEKTERGSGGRQSVGGKVILGGGGAEELAIEADSEILIWETLLLKA